MKNGNNLRAYTPMTETMYYILLSLTEPRHGYGIILHVRDITNGRLELVAGTIYNSLGKMLRDGLVVLLQEEDKENERRKTYHITDLGKTILRNEVERLKELSGNGKAALTKAV